jgi:hypothetical protein
MAPRTRSQNTQGHRAQCLVTGGLGFLGQHLVRQLVDSGKYDVRVFDIRDTPVPGAEVVKGDLRDQAQVDAAVAGCEVVFHCATAAPTGENALNIKLMHSVNVLGTQHIVAACQKVGPWLARLPACQPASLPLPPPPAPPLQLHAAATTARVANGLHRPAPVAPPHPTPQPQPQPQPQPTPHPTGGR